MSQEKILKLRRLERVKELEIQRVVDLCLRACRIPTLLDIGTGSGLFAEAFSARGVEVQGVDPDPDMIEAARAFVPGLHLQVAEAESLPYAAGAFDACFMGMVLHETQNPKQALVEACRVARDMVAVLEWPTPRPEDPEPTTRRITAEEMQTFAQLVECRSMSTFPLQHMALYLIQLLK
jgi:ubiquinone/menaquinone biosynthesis C-methylase UbiE